MTNLRSLLPRVAVSLSIALLAVATVDGRVVRRQSTDEGCAALDAFQQRVDTYAALHRHLAASARTHLAAAIRTARATARQGDFFTPDVARFFRVVIEETTSPADLATFVPLMDEDGRLLPGIHPGIHTPFPVWEESREVSASTLFMLPTLPPELEYRIVHYDLVLWDVTADLIIDVLPYALPHPQSDVMYR